MTDFDLSKHETHIDRSAKAQWNRCVEVARCFVQRTPSLLKELYMVHKMVSESVPYVVTGEAEDNAWVYKNRSFIEEYASDEMRNQGYLPVIDGTSNLSVSFDAETERFLYTITLPGYKVGIEKAKRFKGILAQEGLLIDANMEKVSVIEL